jgi:hypothetical protein
VASPQGSVDARDVRVVGNGGRGVVSQAMVLRDVTIRGNRGGGVAGGWDDGFDRMVLIRRSIIQGNHSDGVGGGLRCHGGCLVIGSRIVGNRVDRHGGGIYLEPVAIEGSASRVRDSVIARNRAGGSGGAIYNASGWRFAREATILRNNQPNDCTGC